MAFQNVFHFLLFFSVRQAQAASTITNIKELNTIIGTTSDKNSESVGE